MSLTFNMIGGGSGGGITFGDAMIRVKAPLGSTVAFSKGGVVAKTLSPSDAFADPDGKNANYYYSISQSNYGEWVVTATKDTNTKNFTLTVNASQQYDVELRYQTMLYDTGNLYGYDWKISREEDYNYQTPSGQRLYVSQNGNGMIVPHIGFFINSIFDLSNYTTFYAHILDTTAYINSVVLFLTSDIKQYQQIPTYLYNPSTMVASETINWADLPNDMIVSFDISNIQGSYYLNIGGNGGSAQLTCILIVDKVWLE